MDPRGIAYSVGRVATNPSRFLRLHYSKVLALVHQTLGKDNFWILNRAFGIQQREYDRLERDLTGDAEFRMSIEARYGQVRKPPLKLFAHEGAGDANPAGRLLYHCVRLVKPEDTVDTSVLDGFSTGCILKGMHDNGRGHLHSIDLPAYEEIAGSSNQMSLGKLPLGHEPGWVVPDYLRHYWTLKKGGERGVAGSSSS